MTLSLRRIKKDITYNYNSTRFCRKTVGRKGGGRMDNMTEKERKDTKMATLYELRLLFTKGEKDEYTREEIVEILDKIAIAKEQE